MKGAIQRSCMRDEIRDAIVARILDGTYAAGTRLKELALAREFNTSQAPVREALRELAALHLVETEHYRGTRVRSIDMPELQEAYELRFLIEDAALRRAGKAAEADLAELEKELEAMEQLSRKKSYDRYLDAAMRFHRRLVAMSGNRLFLRAWESMAWDIRVRVAVKSLGRSGIGSADAPRRKIVRALRAGDRRAAAAALGEIRDRVMSRLAKQHDAAAAA